jgi:hypothetical protein
MGPIPGLSTPLIGEVAPEGLPAYMSAPQKMGGELQAPAVYAAAVRWLEERGCLGMVSEQMIQMFAMAAARYIQLESMLSDTGFLGKHPTTQKVIISPLVQACQNQMKIVNQCWYPIWQSAQTSAAARYGGADEDDDELALLSRPLG